MKDAQNGFNVTNITQEEINALPLRAFKGKVNVISSPEAVPAAFEEIYKSKVAGFDTETRPSFKKGQVFKVALMQIAIPGIVYLIRLQHTGLTDDIVRFLEDENIVKAGVGIRDDILALQRMRKFHQKGFVDLSPLAKEAGLQVESVKKLAGLLLGFRISKSAQTSNWEAETLTKKQIEYAATDAWVCLELSQKLGID